MTNDTKPLPWIKSIQVFKKCIRMSDLENATKFDSIESDFSMDPHQYNYIYPGPQLIRVNQGIVLVD